MVTCQNVVGSVKSMTQCWWKKTENPVQKELESMNNEMDLVEIMISIKQLQHDVH